MSEKKKIELTDDSLTNIRIMIPMLDESAREVISYLMYGCYLGEELASRKNKKVEDKIEKNEETDRSRIFKGKDNQSV